MTLTRRQLLSMGKDMGAGLAIASVAPLFGCHHEAKEPKPSSRVISPTLNVHVDGSLKAHATAADILTGCAVVPRMLKSDAAYKKIVMEQCSIVVAENAMKWAALRPAIDTYEFSEADELVAFAEKNEIKLRGHNLVWHEGLPKWFDGQVFKGNAKEVMIDHINTVLGRYSGRMHSWDVVNEAINLDDKRPDGLRNSMWLQMIGEDYIEIAFRTARVADPSALLTYNEFGIELDDHESDLKRAQVLILLRRLKARNVPIDAVGIQSHIPARSLNTAPEVYSGVTNFIAQVRAMGLQVFITELDVSDSAIVGDARMRDRAVATTYDEYLTAVLADPAVKAVLTWGITDRRTWLNGHEHPRPDGMALRPLPFDASYRVKPTFYAIRDSYDARVASLKMGSNASGANPYAPFKPRVKTAAEKAQAAAAQEEAERAMKKGVPAMKIPTTGSSLPSMPTTGQMPSVPSVPTATPAPSLPSVPKY